MTSIKLVFSRPLVTRHWCHQWLSERWPCARLLVVTSFILVVAVAYIWWFLGFFGVTTVNISSSVNKIMLTSFDEYFSAIVSNGWVLHGSSLHSSLEHGDFWAQIFHKAYGIAARWTCGRTCSHFFARNSVLCLSVKGFGNQSAFGKVKGKSIVELFSRTRCILLYSDGDRYSGSDVNWVW